MVRWIGLAAAAVMLTGCVGVIDACKRGLEPPPGGWSSPRPG